MNEINKDEWCMKCDITHTHTYIYIIIMHDKHTLIYLG